MITFQKDLEAQKKVNIVKSSEHIYRIEGVPVSGVTTVTGCFPKEWLAPWASKEACGAVRQLWYPGRAYTREEIEAILDLAKVSFRTKAKVAADKGTAAHSWYEAFIAGGCEILPPMPQDPDTLAAVNAFLEWYKANRVRFVASELIVGSKKYMFGGTLDALAYVNEEFCLVDFKTSSAIHWDFFVQVAGYQLGLEECYEGLFPPVQKRWILRFPKDGSGFEAKIVPSDIGNDKDMFIKALSFLKAMKFYDQFSNKRFYKNAK